MLLGVCSITAYQSHGMYSRGQLFQVDGDHFSPHRVFHISKVHIRKSKPTDIVTTVNYTTISR